MRRSIVCTTICAPLLALAFGNAAHAATVCRVTTAGTGDGSDWTTQAAGLQSALTDTNCTEIWVAKGVYTPGASPDDSFNIRPGVAVYGGFGGTETTRDARDPAANVTILSGDIDGDDTNADGNAIDETSNDIQGANTHHIVVMDGTTAAGNITATTALDGFVLTGGDNFNDEIGGGALLCKGSGTGNACSPALAQLVFSGNRARLGGAMFNAGDDDGTSSPTLTNVTFGGNSTTDDGGAMFNNGADGGTSSPTLTNVTFSGNYARDYGGAMFNAGANGGTSSPTLTNVTFNGNATDGDGGAMHNNGVNSGASSPTLTNVTFSGNRAEGGGGAMYNFGQYSGTVSPVLTNITFSGNFAYYGGAMANDGSFSGTVSPLLTNVTFNGNVAYSGGAMSNGSSSPKLINVILWGDMGGDSNEIYNDFAMVQIEHSILAANGCFAMFGGTCPSTGFVSTDPLLGALADNGGSTQTMLPGAGSAAIDAGTCGGAPVTDQRGVARPQGAGCDIGAVEIREAPLSVSATAGGSVSAGASPLANGDGITDCTSSSGTCSTYYSVPPDVATASVVSLTAAPDAGYHFSSWGGDCASAGGSLSATVTMGQARTCSADFAADTTVTTLVSDINPSSFGQSVTFTATVAPVAPASADPTGTVSFTDGGNAIGCDNQPLSATAPFTATCTVATLVAGSHSIAAQYGGDTNYPDPQPASNTVVQAVDVIVQAITNFAATPAAPVFAVNGTFTVSATGGASGNPVTFSIAPASASVCSAGGTHGETITMLASGTCTVLADQAGNANYAPATQASLSVSIGVAAVVPSVPVPALDRHVLLLLATLIGLIGFTRMREV